MPTTPHSAAGWRIEPPVSEPSPRAAKPAATAAELPPDDPPGTRPVSCGLRVGPKAEFSVELPMANSSRLVLPMTMAPAARSRSTTVASYGGAQPSRIRDEHVVGTPRVHRLSLSATGTPASGPGSSPAAMRASRSSAAASACSAITRLKAWISPSRASMAARCSSTTDRPVRSPARTAVSNAESTHGAPPSTGGTRNMPASVAGAAASTSSFTSCGRTSSGRSTFSSG